MDKIAREYDYGHWVLEQHESKPRPLRVWNGIFAAGDRREKKRWETMSPSRDQTDRARDLVDLLLRLSPGKGILKHLASSHIFLRRRVWNGIFAAGDWRAKRDPKTMSLRRGRKSETTTRENWPHAALSPSLIRAWCVMSVHSPVTPLGGWATWAGGQVISFRPPQFRARRRCNSCELE